MSKPTTSGASVEPSIISSVTGRKLVKTFGATAALRGVDIELLPGALTMIEGANGSGKTTLLRILGTMLRPSSGSVDYRPIGSDPHEVRRRLGWLSHESLSYGDLSGRENVRLAAELHGINPDEAWSRAEARFELGRFAERPVRTASRGQRQRIALARALVHSPSLLLLDEPTTGLDRAGVERLSIIVGEELARGAIVAVVTHEPRLFADHLRRRVVLERGTVSEREE
jgi:heme exporter protein A